MVGWEHIAIVYSLIAARVFYVATIGVAVVLRDERRGWRFQLVVCALCGLLWPLMFGKPGEFLVLMFASRRTIRDSLRFYCKEEK